MCSSSILRRVAFRGLDSGDRVKVSTTFSLRCHSLGYLLGHLARQRVGMAAWFLLQQKGCGSIIVNSDIERKLVVISFACLSWKGERGPGAAAGAEEQ